MVFVNQKNKMKTIQQNVSCQFRKEICLVQTLSILQICRHLGRLKTKFDDGIECIVGCAVSRQHLQ